MSERQSILSIIFESDLSRAKSDYEEFRKYVEANPPRISFRDVAGGSSRVTLTSFGGQTMEAQAGPGSVAAAHIPPPRMPAPPAASYGGSWQPSAAGPDGSADLRRQIDELQSARDSIGKGAQRDILDAAITSMRSKLSTLRAGIDEVKSAARDAVTATAELNSAAELGASSDLPIQGAAGASAGGAVVRKRAPVSSRSRVKIPSSDEDSDGPSILGNIRLMSAAYLAYRGVEQLAGKFVGYHHQNALMSTSSGLDEQLGIQEQAAGAEFGNPLRFWTQKGLAGLPRSGITGWAVRAGTLGMSDLTTGSTDPESDFEAVRHAKQQRQLQSQTDSLRDDTRRIRISNEAIGMGSFAKQYHDAGAAADETNLDVARTKRTIQGIGGDGANAALLAAVQTATAANETRDSTQADVLKQLGRVDSKLEAEGRVSSLLASGKFFSAGMEGLHSERDAAVDQADRDTLGLPAADRKKHLDRVRRSFDLKETAERSDAQRESRADSIGLSYGTSASQLERQGNRDGAARRGVEAQFVNQTKGKFVPVVDDQGNIRSFQAVDASAPGIKELTKQVNASFQEAIQSTRLDVKRQRILQEGETTSIRALTSGDTMGAATDSINYQRKAALEGKTDRSEIDRINANFDAKKAAAVNDVLRQRILMEGETSSINSLVHGDPLGAKLMGIESQRDADLKGKTNTEEIDRINANYDAKRALAEKQNRLDDDSIGTSLGGRMRSIDLLKKHNRIGAEANDVATSTDLAMQSLANSGHADRAAQMKDVGLAELGLMKQNYMESFRGAQVDLRNIDVRSPNDVSDPASVVKSINDAAGLITTGFKEALQEAVAG